MKKMKCGLRWIGLFGLIALNICSSAAMPLTDFLMDNEVSDNDYILTYKCRHFAADLNADLRAEGFQSNVIRITNQELTKGHAMVLVEEDGIIYLIEPQSENKIWKVDCPHLDRWKQQIHEEERMVYCGKTFDFLGLNLSSKGWF